MFLVVSMGCLQSRRDVTDMHPNVFKVVNLDENGVELCSGQIEVTESDLILYREQRDTTVWPLHSLRRYGFEGEMFSFESGRRCDTGEGIYAFRCHRAALLFRTLQQQIQLRNVIHEAVPYPVSRLSPSPQTRQTLQASVVHRSSIDNGLPEPTIAVINNNMETTHSMIGNMAQSPRSPSSADILEVMPLYPRPQNTNKHVTNVYQLRDFKKEHNNNQAETSTEMRHEYCNDINRDLAMLRNTLHQKTAINTMRDIEDETRFLENKYRNEKINSNHAKALSPTLSNSSERYAQLSMEHPDSARPYMNIIPDTSTDNKESPATPLTPKPVEYCNLSLGHKELNTYANLSLGDMAESVKNAKLMLNLNHSELQRISENDTGSPTSPVEDSEVNYAILDIDSNKEAKVFRDVLSPETQSNSSKTDSISQSVAQSRSRLISQTSLDKSLSIPSVAPSAIVGYTTIDFDKTTALTSVAAETDIDPDCPRKTRHNSTSVMCGSPNNNDKNKNIN